MVVSAFIFAILAIAIICQAVKSRRARKLGGATALPATTAGTSPAGGTHSLQAAVLFDDEEPSETCIRARWDVVDVTRQGNRIAVEYLSERDWLKLASPQSEVPCSAE